MLELMKFVQVMHSGFWRGCQTCSLTRFALWVLCQRLHSVAASSCYCPQSANQHTIRWISEPKVQFWGLPRPPNNCPPIDEAKIQLYWPRLLKSRNTLQAYVSCDIFSPPVANWDWNKAISPLHWDTLLWGECDWPARCKEGMCQ